VDTRLMLLVAMFVASLLTDNVIAGKIVQVFGWVTVPAAVVTYATTFLFSDVINELYGKSAARRVVFIGFAAQAFAMVMILLGRIMPVAPFATETQHAYDVLLGSNWRIVLASWTAYFCSQLLDVYVFSRIREATRGRKKWLRQNASTMLSQLVDTIVFISIAFAGMVPNLWVMVVSQYIVKVVLSVIETPFFYLLTLGSTRLKHPSEAVA
jgi:uncharacterized integral membrane protein (TIGR00697 family)